MSSDSNQNPTIATTSEPQQQPSPDAEFSAEASSSITQKATSTTSASAACALDATPATAANPAPVNPTPGSTSSNIVTRPGPNDCLMGRGAPVSEHEGNARLRQIVIERHADYVAPNLNRKGKHQVAVDIVAVVTGRGGRFLRKLEDGHDEQPEQGEGEQDKPPCSSSKERWEIVTNQRDIIRKVKQLLRDMAPEARQKRAERHLHKHREHPAIEGLWNTASTPMVSKKQKTKSEGGDKGEGAGAGPERNEKTASTPTSLPSSSTSAQHEERASGPAAASSVGTMIRSLPTSLATAPGVSSFVRVPQIQQQHHHHQQSLLAASANRLHWNNPINYSNPHLGFIPSSSSSILLPQHSQQQQLLGGQDPLASSLLLQQHQQQAALGTGFGGVTPFHAGASLVGQMSTIETDRILLQHLQQKQQLQQQRQAQLHIEALRRQQMASALNHPHLQQFHLTSATQNPPSLASARGDNPNATAVFLQHDDARSREELTLLLQQQQAASAIGGPADAASLQLSSTSVAITGVGGGTGNAPPRSATHNTSRSGRSKTSAKSK